MLRKESRKIFSTNLYEKEELKTISLIVKKWGLQHKKDCLKVWGFKIISSKNLVERVHEAFLETGEVCTLSLQS